ncbi:Nucleoside phosphorylase [Chitinophaga rupis]|uniref:Nucleoside phosphorylase n=1 Tax=Chitinophaga rupis TaxID=573321 RepID=A0A1H8D0I4_9BACT|nr:hypothetical protein [Chitinophaga rupis]SEM99967.1 Nucleoside phosphorylase [Chitinophaga rupis]
MSIPSYQEVDSKTIPELLNGSLILLVTATELETKNLHEALSPISGRLSLIKVHGGASTYYFGKFGKYNIAHVQCSMGSVSRASSITTVTDAILFLKVTVVVMIGIAFGVDSTKQNIGDVLISESIIPYDSKRVGSDEIIQRGMEAQCSKILLNRFKNIRDWEYFIREGVLAKLIPTRLLSGEELIDNIDHRNKLIGQNPDSKGGEMEGVGVFAACDGKANWILVKGICDFADGNKGLDKELRQTTAIQSALDACVYVFNSDTAFRDLEIFPASNAPEKQLVCSIPISKVLFEVYDKSKDAYYIVRGNDANFNIAISQFSVWVFGPSGVGKSNLIIRNLQKGKVDFVQIGLAACVGQDIDVYFTEIFLEIASKNDPSSKVNLPATFQECSRALFNILKKEYSDRTLIIFVEEIPISSEEDYSSFITKFCSILFTKNLHQELDGIKFVLSSINDPQKYLKAFQQKIHQGVSFFPLEYWSEQDINNLVDLIEKELDFPLPSQSRQRLLGAAKGSPRFVKKFFRSLLTINDFSEPTIRFVLSETEREFNQYNNG